MQYLRENPHLHNQEVYCIEQADGVLAFCVMGRAMYTFLEERGVSIKPSKIFSQFEKIFCGSSERTSSFEVLDTYFPITGRSWAKAIFCTDKEQALLMFEENLSCV